MSAIRNVFNPGNPPATLRRVSEAPNITGSVNEIERENPLQKNAMEICRAINGGAFLEKSIEVATKSFATVLQSLTRFPSVVDGRMLQAIQAKGVFIDIADSSHFPFGLVVAISLVKESVWGDPVIVRALAHAEAGGVSYSEMSALERVLFLANHIDGLSEENKDLTLKLLWHTKDIKIATLVALSASTTEEFNSGGATDSRNILRLRRELYRDFEMRREKYKPLTEYNQIVRCIDRTRSIDYFAEAKALFDNGEKEQALNSLRESLKLTPDFVDAKILLILLVSKEEASALCDEVCNQDCADIRKAEAIQWTAAHFLSARDYEGAIQLFKKALTFYQGNVFIGVMIYEGLKNTYLALGKYDEAKDAIWQMLNLDIPKEDKMAFRQELAEIARAQLQGTPIQQEEPKPKKANDSGPEGWNN
ncbi:hypothetical protein A2526_00785 [candidate division WOR-1 bacterium RIFOXYD2_FULL_36_8]|uniref:Tetratricopeptide repeat protein n=1 Tax=candidate division WOR-1 bacterium RIFOXYB2_FULL_36_35 TaxID=1802578 RepID=A0A1F4S0Y1_UNCSA|nr:MAG: hypothetical protein A2230_00720 [candidate division WOR-1 bacterium RIFOXYA2_FULL_36_21]OGC14091.1 MAG: hypothetical protein A2290_06265 [candidate division WOR-1 bacterium RIFOXYB2_FULL_36_35]OGC16533.1 MAG: hypothetical protein A2282_02245 [candidate division WOR-1 bacterium RIFOXYA12_FULL_36_13]OGC39019.1 MAG: hypothetical protein A2526_00785 [candidate division WOR-1 bacterium RIFOXYD2_FULL_36_8]